MVKKPEFYPRPHNLDAQPIEACRAVIFFNLMTAIEQKNQVIPSDRARILHQ